jgi:hypothetical protein
MRSAIASLPGTARVDDVLGRGRNLLPGSLGEAWAGVNGSEVVRRKPAVGEGHPMFRAHALVGRALYIAVFRQLSMKQQREHRDRAPMQVYDILYDPEKSPNARVDDEFVAKLPVQSSRGDLALIDSPSRNPPCASVVHDVEQDVSSTDDVRPGSVVEALQTFVMSIHPCQHLVLVCPGVVTRLSQSSRFRYAGVTYPAYCGK